MRIVVSGTGYVGLVTAVCFADRGHSVTCVDVDANKIESLRRGIVPIYEPDLQNLMLRNSSRLTYTTEYQDAYREAELIFIGVGTPEKKDGSANLAYIYSVAGQIAESATKNCVVVIKSTVPIGTSDKVAAFLNEHKSADITLHVVSNPEFLAQGTAVRDTLHPSRIVIGVDGDTSHSLMEEVYRGFESPILFTDRKSAEMVKYASNDFLALKVSYINEIANLCESVGAHIDDVALGMGMDSRIGNKFLKAGIGYGGSCFPKDTKALHWLSIMNDYELKTVKAAIEVNERQKLRLIKKARKYYDNFRGLNIAVLGLTFKPGTDDLREAPSLVNIPVFLEEGASVRVFDPVGMERFKRAINEMNLENASTIQFCSTIDAAIADTDMCFVFTEWDEIRNYDATNFEKLMRSPIVLDGRNCIDPSGARGMVYEGIGNPKSS